jgi:F-type H+-transporting ATPase subunit b
MLDLDLSLIVVSVLVGILMLVLNRVYLNPISQVIHQRETKIAEESSQIESNMLSVEEKTRHIETILKEAQRDSRNIKEELIKKGEEVREQVIVDARENSKKLFKTKLEQLDEQILAAEKELEKEIYVFSNKIKDIFIS